MSWRRSWVFLLLLTLMASAAPAYAQSGHEDRDSAARELFALGKYAEALTIYGKLYAETSHPTYLRNIGRCYQNLGEPDKAIGSFREYLRQAKNLSPEQRTVVEGYVREMEELKQRRDTTGTSSAVHPVPQAALPPAATAPVSESPAPVIARPAAGGEGAAKIPDDAAGTRRTVAYVLGGAGVVALGVGTFYGIRAFSRERDSQSDCPAGPCGTAGFSLNQQAKTDARVSDFTVGAGLIGAGVATYLFFTSRASSAGGAGGAGEAVGSTSSQSVAERVRVAPELGPHQVGLLAGGSW